MDHTLLRNGIEIVCLHGAFAARASPPISLYYSTNITNISHYIHISGKCLILTLATNSCFWASVGYITITSCSISSTIVLPVVVPTPHYVLSSLLRRSIS